MTPPTGSPHRWGWVRKTCAVIGIGALSLAAFYGLVIASASMQVEGAADVEAIARGGIIAIVLAVVGLAAGATWFFLKKAQIASPTPRLDDP